MSKLTQLLCLAELDQQQLSALLDLALDIKQSPNNYRHALQGRSIALLFEKPSLRTRVSFDVGIHKLGGHSVYLDLQNGAMGERESVEDFGSNLACWTDAIVARVYSQKTLVRLALSSKKPVINALSDIYHPCQALADLLTLKEQYGDLSQVHLAYVGDGNNVCQSLMLGAAIMGMDLTVVTPQGFGPDAHVLLKAQEIAQRSGAKLTLSQHVSSAAGADAIYTDTWLSMGTRSDPALITEIFSPYQINTAVMQRLAVKHFMHCLPAHRGHEVTSEVLDSEHSLALQQAENRMHAQNAVLVSLFS
ncbi:ornithine carbamoyltransferase [Alishewanella sp. 16-MA]|uniref:Ornithine carbamoyltransferase n=1 Tax=Alishewanella maricola TaxID=2795740 RepID=A0ABS8C3U5_9ALTE|nr:MULTISPECIES: ornithine carbamoyltransferase [Alishewanella]MDP4944587.1 ornithine carbamoyltransferase [Alishewanella sp.]MDP5206984.1 ornithine carbamoyltransferase [Alishewanella sp. SMS9]MCB5226992.1 ornithine carbamoyltransferase [Alishewanella maricola]MDP5035228.1 ornithine carbamoyltransferase [Alishewanella sp.]MDP5187730.1 ornithine carbamoyltransferase [Alishewanella sp.]